MGSNARNPTTFLVSLLETNGHGSRSEQLQAMPSSRAGFTRQFSAVTGGDRRPKEIGSALRKMPLQKSKRPLENSRRIMGAIKSGDVHEHGIVRSSTVNRNQLEASSSDFQFREVRSHRGMGERIRNFRAEPIRNLGLME